MSVCRMFNTSHVHQVLSNDGQLFAERTDKPRRKRDNDV